MKATCQFSAMVRIRLAQGTDKKSSRVVRAQRGSDGHQPHAARKEADPFGKDRTTSQPWVRCTYRAIVPQAHRSPRR